MATQELDVRGLRKPDKHPAIFQTYEALQVGESVDLVNDHDPKHLRDEFEIDHPGSHAWEYLDEGAEAWRIRITKLSSTPLPRVLCDTTMVVAEAVKDRATLDLLHALTEADGKATGPAAWSEWKAGLVADLVRRTRAVLETGTPPPSRELTDAQRQLIEKGTLALVADMDGRADTLTVVYPDSPGVLATLAGVLALHRVDIHSLDAVTEGPVGLVTVRTALRYGSQPDWTLVRDDLCRAIEGRLELADNLAARAAAYAAPASAAPAQVQWVDGASERASVLEVRCPDSVGLLYRTASALTRSGMDVSAAFCTTLGGDVVDTFYVTTATGGTVDDMELKSSVRSEVLAAVSGG